ncbi:MAG: class I SAM-dependent methyltransferase [Geobacteraceae bacterium]|nr:MAG: class I SAM-dependent methyltransferase [Geobacteraceae bacterium]
MDDSQLKLLTDFHRHAIRQGPGGEKETGQALELARLDRSRPLKIADIGCGTGASTIQLAKQLDAEITAVDFLGEFLDELKIRADKEGVAGKITTINCSMDELPFAPQEFDVVWSEGAIYNMGFEAGVTAWKRILKPGGKLIVSEITWLTATRPSELQNYWGEAYPEVDVASAKISILENHGYCPEAYFVLPKHCWRENYYQPMQGRFEEFLARHGRSEDAQTIVEEEKREIALYEKYSSYYSYGVYVSRKL